MPSCKSLCINCCGKATHEISDLSFEKLHTSWKWGKKYFWGKRKKGKKSYRQLLIMKSIGSCIAVWACTATSQALFMNTFSHHSAPSSRFCKVLSEVSKTLSKTMQIEKCVEQMIKRHNRKAEYIPLWWSQVSALAGSLATLRQGCLCACWWHLLVCQHLLLPCWCCSSHTHGYQCLNQINKQNSNEKCKTNSKIH